MLKKSIKVVLGLAIVAAMGLLVAACGGNGNDGNAPAPVAANPPAAVPAPAAANPPAAAPAP
ncbi:MAG: carbohydrate ABC transporter substrate-binding protein, partial [Defluviitaleaceae bacterium]|nr:carbohydrate ABC transporter substrate-binding protein [Defluviitaleaceae bacterium]